MSFYAQILSITIIQLVAIMSPGPDFAIICRNSLVYSRRTGIYSALGISLGILVHVTYTLVGIGVIISKSIVLFSFIKLLGAAYLIYIGYKSLKAQPSGKINATKSKHDLSRQQAIRIGFITNILNPKVTLFFFSLFTQVISPNTPVSIRALYGLQMFVFTLGWFTLLAVAISHPIVKKRFLSMSHYIEKTMGVILIALGIKVALESARY
ncbi:LysE family transporter [Synechocystis sp. PCC 7509]|uniref:LysE family transporter n=1 Tax=Synechocystis sp. PCC 7509 TaxID=927677 RepID=UPI0002AC75B3|nr:LysE family transporter [Synechocystis sp. PCC 7509]